MGRLKVLQIGPISYVGGVSIHIKRLTLILKKSFEFSYLEESSAIFTPKETFNIRRAKDFFEVLRMIKANDLVHIHCGNWLSKIYVIFLTIILSKKFIITLHSFRISGIKKKITFFFLSKAFRIVTVNDEIKNMLPIKLKEKTIVKEAFLPPILEVENDLPHDVLVFINSLKDDNILICANAFRLTKYKAGELYGIDQCIKLAMLAKHNEFKLHIIFVIGTIKKEDKEYVQSFLTDISLNKLEMYITVMQKSISFIRLIEKCDITLRPTLTDGDALTIREAIFLGKKVIASDVVKRPIGVKLYETGNVDSLFEQIKKASKLNLEIEKNNKKLSNKSYEVFYSKLYNLCKN